MRSGVWKEIRARAITVGLEDMRRREAEVTDETPEAKRLRMTVTRPSNVPKSSDDDEWEMFGSETAEEMTEVEASPEERVGKLTDAEIEQFWKLNYKPSIVPPQAALGYWARNGKLHFKHLRGVAEQVFGNQASAAQIERDFSGAGQLLSSRRSRLDGFYVEMLLFLHLNFSKIPVAVPALTTASISSFIPKRFTGADPELREANDFVDPVGAGIPMDVDDDADHLEEGEETPAVIGR